LSRITSELAVQVHGILSHFAEAINVASALVIGGTHEAAGDEAVTLSHAKIIVGTPGRLEYSIVRQPERTRALIDCKNLEILILDEADRLLDMGFERSLNSILQCLPKQRRTVC
jgi:ATP-dependent RNA helicase DDX55/SPB4